MAEKLSDEYLDREVKKLAEITGQVDAVDLRQALREAVMNIYFDGYNYGIHKLRSEGFKYVPPRQSDR